jgi:hypothetical protein
MGINCDGSCRFAEKKMAKPFDALAQQTHAKCNFGRNKKAVVA